MAARVMVHSAVLVPTLAIGRRRLVAAVAVICSAVLVTTLAIITSLLGPIACLIARPLLAGAALPDNACLVRALPRLVPCVP